LTSAHLWRGEYETVLALKERALCTMKGGFHLRSYARSVLIASFACTELGRWDEAIELGQGALKAAREFADSNLISWSAWTISVAYTCKRDLEKAIEYAELSLTAAHTPTEKVMAQAILAWAWCHTGESKKGIEMLVGLVALAHAAGTIVSMLWHTHYLAEGYCLACEFDKARETARQLLELAERFNAPGHLGKAHRLLGEVALRTNRDEAGPHFDRAISLFREIKAENELALALAGYGRLHKQRENREQARDYLTQALEIFERLGTLIEPDKVRRELADLPH
jgi:tetratricopeptide (TPR) repeat protein